jgi:hypothetical protein
LAPLGTGFRARARGGIWGGCCGTIGSQCHDGEPRWNRHYTAEPPTWGGSCRCGNHRLASLRWSETLESLIRLLLQETAGRLGVGFGLASHTGGVGYRFCWHDRVGSGTCGELLCKIVQVFAFSFRAPFCTIKANRKPTAGKGKKPQAENRKKSESRRATPKSIGDTPRSGAIDRFFQAQ